MKKHLHRTPGSHDPHAEARGGEAEVLLKCEDIQGLLFAYMSRELGDVQSTVVREHIRKCNVCRAEAADIEATLALLHKASDVGVTHSATLTDARRARILRAVFHPVIDWIDVHHRLVSIVMTAIVLVAAFFYLRDLKLFQPKPLEDRIPIWQMFKSGELPELVEQGLREGAEAGGERAEDGGQASEGGDRVPEDGGSEGGERE